jgi:hypothetical protein
MRETKHVATPSGGSARQEAPAEYEKPAITQSHGFETYASGSCIAGLSGILPCSGGIHSGCDSGKKPKAHTGCKHRG